MSANRWRAGLAASAVALLVVAAWLFLPRAALAVTRPPLHVALVDVSASVAREPGWLPWARNALFEEARAAEASGAELAVVAYADGAATVFAPGAPRALVDELQGRDGRPLDPRSVLPRDGATRLAQALELCVPLLEDAQRAPGSLVLLGDGGFTGESPTPALRRLAGLGVRVLQRAPPPGRSTDVAVLELDLPERVEPGAALAARARVLWRRAQRDERAWLTVAIENGGVRSTSDVEIVPGNGDDPFDLPIECGTAGDGRTTVEVTARVEAGPDAWPENDRARASTLAEGARSLAVLASVETEALVREWLAPEGRAAFPGLELDFVPATELASVLRDSAGLVTCDVSPSELPDVLVRDFLARGGGWLALAGWRFLDDWRAGHEPSALQELLPLAPRASDVGPRDVVLLTDGSGSMEGTPFETVRAAALELVRAALPADRVALRFFTTELEDETLLRPRAAGLDAAERAARELLRVRLPSGATHLLHSLEAFAATLGETETLAFLLTDGREREPQPDASARASELAARLERSKTRLVVVAVGDADEALLGGLAGGVEHVLRGETLGDLRAIFRRELHAELVVEGAVAVRAGPRAAGSLAAEVAGVSDGGEPLPPLERHARAQLRPGAELSWKAASDDPVLALQRAGGGRTALFAALPVSTWGASWAGDAGHAAFDPLLRWIAREPAAASGVEAHLDGTTLALEGLDESWPPIVTGRIESAATGSAMATSVELLPPSALGLDPLQRREATLAAVPAGELVLVLDEHGRPAVPVRRGLTDEFARREKRVDLVGAPALAQRGSGASGRGSRALAPWFLGFGLLAVVGAALVRGRQGEARNVR